MRHGSGYKSLGMCTSRRFAFLRSISVSLIMNGRVKTTLARAKSLRPFFERLVTKSKSDSLASKRLLLSRLVNKAAVDRLISAVAPRYSQRFGGYVRIFKIGYRAGDNAPLALIELVD